MSTSHDGSRLAAAANGQSIAAGCRNAGITEQTFYRWRREYSGLNVEQAKRLKTHELENNRLKKVVADQALDIPPAPEAILPFMSVAVDDRTTIGPTH